MNSIPTFNVDSFYIPPENQGQIVEVSYGYDCEHEVIVERTLDRSDGELSFVAYLDPCLEDEDFDPWNGRPELGEEIGPCKIA